MTSHHSSKWLNSRASTYSGHTSKTFVTPEKPGLINFHFFAPIMNVNQIIFELNTQSFLSSVSSSRWWYNLNELKLNIIISCTQFDTQWNKYFILGLQSHYGCTLCFPCCVSNNGFVCVRHAPFGLLMCQSIQLISEIHTLTPTQNM